MHSVAYCGCWEDFENYPNTIYDLPNIIYHLPCLAPEGAMNCPSLTVHRPQPANHSPFFLAALAFEAFAHEPVSQGFFLLFCKLASDRGWRRG
jgi:hypothetical protein